jgi:tellurite resistance protein TehA-like permease
VSKPTLHDGINGSWLVAIVATQSVSVLSSRVAFLLPARQDQILLLALLTWLFGGMLYIWIISLIFYRYTFLKFTAGDLSPPYWINMGAMAISTLAGALLIQSAPVDPLLRELVPFLKGLTLLFWATGSWWIPLLLPGLQPSLHGWYRPCFPLVSRWFRRRRARGLSREGGIRGPLAVRRGSLIFIALDQSAVSPCELCCSSFRPVVA